MASTISLPWWPATSSVESPRGASLSISSGNSRFLFLADPSVSAKQRQIPTIADYTKIPVITANQYIAEELIFPLTISRKSFPILPKTHCARKGSPQPDNSSIRQLCVISGSYKGVFGGGVEAAFAHISTNFPHRLPTRQMFDRYNTIDMEDSRKAVEQLQSHFKSVDQTLTTISLGIAILSYYHFVDSAHVSGNMTRGKWRP
ncbi:MAG: hypothetical protein JRJ47_14570 [Deltaproteobacteria bacterium]|nr:hypothetical protein [Deltaproteobacteria bacterium]